MCHPGSERGTPRAADPLIGIPIRDGTEMPALRVSPETAAVGAVLVVPDIFGLAPLYRDLAVRLANMGYDAVVADYLARAGDLGGSTYEAAMERRSRLDEATAVADVIDAAAWHAAQLGDTAGSATIGFCLGGTLVLNVATRVPGLATVCFYGFPAGTKPESDRTLPGVLDHVGDISGPLLGMFGGDDLKVGPENVRTLGDRLSARGSDAEDAEVVVYPGRDHGFMGAISDPEADGHGDADDAWQRVATFLQTHVAGRKASS